MTLRTLAKLALSLLLVPCLAARGLAQTSVEIDSVVLRPMQVAEVPAQQTGLLLKIVVNEGQVVKRDQVLAELDSRDAQLAVARAKVERTQAEIEAKNQIQIKYAEKALEVARAELVRSQESIEKFPKSISQSQLDVERLTVEKLMLERKQSEHELSLKRYDVKLKQNDLDSAQLKLDQHRLQAPFAGTVVLIRGREGEWVELGAPVLQLMAIDRLRAEGFLAAELATSQLAGKNVRLRCQTGEKELTASGRVRFVSPEMDPVTRQVRVWAEIDNSKGLLRPGQQGVLEILP